MKSARLALAIAAACVVLGGLPAAAPGGGAWREAPAYLALFTAERAHPGAYRAYVSALDLDAALDTLSAEPGLLRPPGSWQPRAMLPAEAFGRDGDVDRWRLARLYGARRALVARGPLADEGRVRETWTLISPYPDPALRALERGTLLIVLRLP